MCLDRGKVVDLDGDLICYKIYREKKNIFGKKHYRSLYQSLSDGVKYKVGKTYNAKIQHWRGNIETVNGEKVECKWFAPKRGEISTVRSGVFHLFRDLQSAEKNLNRLERIEECKSLVIAECFVPRDSKVVILGSKKTDEENIVCSKTIKIRKIVDRSWA